MSTLNAPIKKTAKHRREHNVLIGLIEYYIKTGKPVGSNTLKDAGFGDLSSATIRNYFANLEEEGYLIQQHASGGRIPTSKAFRLYAVEATLRKPPKKSAPNPFDLLKTNETRAIASMLQQAAEQLAATTKTAVFLSAPRFEQDFIINIKFVPIDTGRCLCILMTDFGEVKTELLYHEHKMSTLSAKRIEAYFNWRLSGVNKPEGLTKEEEETASRLYNELVLRYVVGYTEFHEEDIHRTGFSTLLTYPEFHDPLLLSGSLALFENTQGMRLLLKEAAKHNTLRVWIGDDLITYTPKNHTECAVIAVPYHVNHQPVGAVGLLGPQRIPYPVLFDALQHFTQRVSEALTRNLYKFKITMKTPKSATIDMKRRLIESKTIVPLLEDKTQQTGSAKPAARRK